MELKLYLNKVVSFSEKKKNKLTLDPALLVKRFWMLEN